MKTKKLCSACRKFFTRYRCSAATHGECDCPRCQGYCNCEEMTHDEFIKARNALRNY